MASILRWQKEPATRRLAVWMAVGAAFVLGLAVSEYSHSATPIFLPGWLPIAGLAVLVAGLVLIGARQPSGTRCGLRLLNGGASRLSSRQTESPLSRCRQGRAPIPFPVIGRK